MLHIHCETKYDFGAAEFAALFDGAQASGFQHPIWLGNFYNLMCPEQGAQACIVTLRDDDRLLGVVPLILRNKSGLRLLETTDLGVSDYAAPVLSDELQDMLVREPALKQQFQSHLPAHDVLRIRPIRDEHLPQWQLLFDGVAQKLDFSAHAVELAEPFDEWRVAHLDRSMASQMKRKAKRWQKQHDVELGRAADASQAKAAIFELAALRTGRFDGDPIQQNAVRQFYEQVAAMGADTGFAETWILKSDGDIAAIVFGITHKGSFLYLLIGCDYEQHGRHSPGLQIYDWLIQDWMGRNGTSFDFTIGDEPFKAQFGTQAHGMNMLLGSRSLKGKFALAFFKGRIARTGGSDG